MAKIMVVIRDENFRLLSLDARDRGITIQELIRAVIVPDWIRNFNAARSRQGNNPLVPAPNLGGETEVPLLSRSRP
jgi:hypothetical protein